VHSRHGGVKPRRWLYNLPRSAGAPGAEFGQDSERRIATSNNPAAEYRSRKALILLANEPRAYRETLAHVFRQLRPNVEVVTVEPDELDDYVLILIPEMVIFSEATGVVRERVPVWVELYPGYEPRSVVGIGEERSTIEEIQLSDLLSIIDRIERLARGGGATVDRTR
jgi:hypothetical protein